MPFGQKNADATYQRLVNQMFSKQIGRNMEVYVDDMLVKSKEAKTHLEDLQETFDTLRSSALICEESKVQRPVYYTSQVFQGVKAKYPRIEKMAFSLIVASRKLHPYFQANTIMVMTDQPIQKAMSKLDAAGRMVQWAVELSQFDIEYKLRTAIKAQALADFITEFTLPNLDLEAEYWTIYANGSSVAGLRGIGVIITSLEKDVLKYGAEKDVLKYGVQLQFPTTSNEAEYEAVLTSLRIAKALGIKNLKLRTDSKLIIRQITNEYEAKEERMKRYLKLTTELIDEFDDIKFKQIPQENNSAANEVAKLVSTEDALTKPELFMEV
ncbi:uncharacterized protein LOC142624589 [Castanea sativa]|uniref:uncharacterized protein LOC142624589 n=1 Tax=Castanea sativa TaxID=21020 RepID=UPI003F64CBFF